MARLSRSFYGGSATAIAPALLGRVLVRRLTDGMMLRARIVETEAYGPDDPASHAYGGRTPRNRTMFGPPGRLYVYFTYGMHWCMNVVTGDVGDGSAVLLRAAEPLGGLERMVTLRGTDRIRDLCRGPARLAQALQVDGVVDGVDLVRGSPLWIEHGEPIPVTSIRSGPRVGVAKGTDRPWRFWQDGSPWVSSWRPGRGASQEGLRAKRP